MSLALETERLEIRPWLAKDVDHYLTLANDVGYTAFSLAGQFALDPNEAVERIKDRIDLFESKKVGKFLLFSKNSHELIGTCGLGAYEIDGHEEMEIGYRLRLQHWGKGYATEAAESTLDYGFRTLGLDRIVAFALSQNRPSIRVIEKLGYRYLKHFLHAEISHALYEMTRGHYQQRSTLAKTPHPLIAIDHTRLMVKNLEQSKNWYSNVLGISPWLDTPDYVEFRVGQGGLAMSLSDEKSPYSTGGQVAYWRVQDIKRAISFFTAHGATTFRGPLNIENDEAICQISDPFGNIVGLIGKTTK
jgi:RimJ/RimL family protein N-acetyltransferase/predicted enzyme related to lactoylglutathione lyase